VLLNQGERLESDFYPYRYFASEGFLPGYNFPRLPLRAWVAGRDEHGKETADSIDRPRFLALSEFGPWNIIYHEGRKHRVSACILPAGDLDARITRAQLCKACGYVHPRDAVDICEHCGTLLDADTSDFPQALLDQPAVRTRRSERISADEEERSREGYHITTHYRFADGSRPKQAQVIGNDETELLELACAPRAALWKINHGWRRARERNGFTIDRDTGQWRPLDTDSSDGLPNDLLDRAPVAGVKPYVYDTRNILLLRPIGEGAHSDLFLYSLAVALQRGIQFVYQVEEPEIQLELIGSGTQRRLLLWEAAEGGAGIWERLVSTSGGFAEVAAKALDVIHFDPLTGAPKAEWADTCSRACYDCLLSYTNQRNHPLLDRYAISGYLFKLASATTDTLVGERDREEHYQWLLARTDPASSFEREFLRFLHDSGLRLPDLAQNTPSPDVYAQPDFYYERDGLPGTCIFIDGPSHDGPRLAEVDHTAREALEDRGFRVITIRFDESLEGQVARHVEIFGRPSQSISQVPNEMRRAQLQERFRVLVDRKYLDTLTPSEEEEMRRLDAEISIMDEPFYRPIIERLRAELPDRRADQA